MSGKFWQVMSVAAIAISIGGCGKDMEVTQQPSGSVTPAAVPAPKAVWTSDFQQLNGSAYLYAPIYVSDRERKSIVKQIKEVASYDSYDGRKGQEIDIRNYLFVNRNDLASRKLLANNNARILKMEEIGDLAPVSKSNPSQFRAMKTVRHLWYVTVTTDTNGDRNLDGSDRQQIAISDVSGTNYTVIIKDIDDIISVYPQGRDRRLVIYRSGNKRFVANIDIATRQTNIKELPAIDK
jgi:hypothetical protein